jgi:two-component system chemotaxis response regulator CheB
VIKVLIVDDSPVVRDFLARILTSDPEIRVVGTAGNGEEAVEAVRDSRPDVVTMDIHMPKMDGFEATRRIMETHPVPIVIVSGSVNAAEVTTSFRAMEAGALTVLARPQGLGHPDHEKSARELIKTVKLMAEVRVIRRWPRPAGAKAPPTGPASRPEAAIKVVAIGASTGGPVVIQRLLAALPQEFPAAVLIVQHMARGFIAGFAEWLAQSSGIPVKVAVHGEPLHPGCAYVAPDGLNMGVGPDGRITLSRGENNNGHCPSVAHLFRSVAESCAGRAIGVLLSGMGKDGAEELGLMKAGGSVTIAQDAESSVVYGMPGEARNLGAAAHVLPPDGIAEALKRLVEKR